MLRGFYLFLNIRLLVRSADVPVLFTKLHFYTTYVYSTCSREFIVAGIRSGCAPNVKLNLNFTGLEREKSFELFDKEHLPAGFFRQINNKLARRVTTAMIVVQIRSKSNILMLLDTSAHIGIYLPPSSLSK